MTNTREEEDKHTSIHGKHTFYSTRFSKQYIQSGLDALLISANERKEQDREREIIAFDFLFARRAAAGLHFLQPVHCFGTIFYFGRKHENTPFPHFNPPGTSLGGLDFFVITQVLRSL